LSHVTPAVDSVLEPAETAAKLFGIGAADEPSGLGAQGVERAPDACPSGNDVSKRQARADETDHFLVSLVVVRVDESHRVVIGRRPAAGE
jgi:hypothetical protein